MSEVATTFSDRHRLRVGDFLSPESAAALHDRLMASDAWKWVLNSGPKVFEIDRASRRAMGAAKLADLDDAVANAATDQFQFRYETIRAPDDRALRGNGPVDLFANFMNSPQMLDWFRQVTGLADIAHIDAQATLYGAGDFLTEHDDAVEGKNRLAAYVLSLSPQWRAEWGGLLLFHDADEAVHGFVPSFNALSLFKVPQRHSVSQVTRFAGAPRLSITGWLRSRI